MTASLLNGPPWLNKTYFILPNLVQCMQLLVQISQYGTDTSTGHLKLGQHLVWLLFKVQFLIFVFVLIVMFQMKYLSSTRLQSPP